MKAALAKLNVGDPQGVYVYAIIATALATVVLVALGRAAARVGGEAAFEREAEG